VHERGHDSEVYSVLSASSTNFETTRVFRLTTLVHGGAAPRQP
jgi:hypothetical protein